MSNLKHSNLIEYIEIFEEDDLLYIIMPFASNGNLLKIM